MLQVAGQTPIFQTRAPTVFNTGGRVSVLLPVLNSGSASATLFTVTNVTAGTSTRVEPALPFVYGDLAPGNSVTILTTFLSSFAVGATVMMTVRGTYMLGTSVFGFTVNRPFVVPAPTAPPIALLQAELQSTVNLSARSWSYTATNREPAGSAHFINAISLELAAPASVSGSPPGWQADTDGTTYVLWYSTDAEPPFASHIAPGASLTGFRLTAPGSARSQGKPFTLTAWNHTTNDAGLVVFATTLVPG